MAGSFQAAVFVRLSLTASWRAFRGVAENVLSAGRVFFTREGDSDPNSSSTTERISLRCRPMSLSVWSLRALSSRTAARRLRPMLRAWPKRETRLARACSETPAPMLAKTRRARVGRCSCAVDGHVGFELVPGATSRSPAEGTACNPDS